MTIKCAGGAKVWLNGELVLSNQKAGTFSETAKGTLMAGWNTILVKACQGKASETSTWFPRENLQGC